MLGLDSLSQLTQECRLTDSGHVFEADFLCTCLDKFIGKLRVILQSVYRRGGDTQCSLCSHACFLGPLDRRLDITNVIQTVKDTCDVGALCMFYLVHQGADIVRNGVHAEGIQATIQHVSLDTGLMKRLAESANGLVRVLTGKEINLLKGTTIGFNTGKTSHFNKYRSNAFQLIFAWLELA